MTRMRVALASANVRLPHKQFVFASALAMRQEADTHLFTYAARGLMPVPTHVPVLMSRFPFAMQKRGYRFVKSSLVNDVRDWQPDLIHLNFLALGGFAADAAEGSNTPLFSTVHAQEPFLMTEPRSGRERWLQRDCESVLRGTTRFLPVSSFLASWLEEIGVSKDRVETHYLGIDTDYWTPSVHPSTRLERPRVIFIGHLTELKGIMQAIRICAQVREEAPHELDIVGDGPLMERVRRYALGHSWMHVHGTMGRDGVRRLLDNATALVLPTRTVDGISDAAPTVLMEAQAMGVPAITFDVGGTSEMLPAGSELLVPASDEAAMCDALLTVLKSNEEEYVGLSKESVAWVVQERSSSRQARRLLARFQSTDGVR